MVPVARLYHLIRLNIGTCCHLIRPIPMVPVAIVGYFGGHMSHLARLPHGRGNTAVVVEVADSLVRRFHNLRAKKIIMGIFV